MEHVMNLIYHIREEIKIKRKIEKIQGVSELTICKRRLKTSVKFPSKPEQKTYTHFFQLSAPLYLPFLQGTSSHTPLTRVSTPRPWMKDNRWKIIKSTGSRVVLANVSE